MNILITMSELGIGGTERALMGVLQAFFREGITVTLLLENTDISKWKDSIPKNVTIRQLSCDTLLANALVGIIPTSYPRNKSALLLKLRQFLTCLLGHLHVPFNKRFDYALRYCDDDPMYYDLALDFYGYGKFATAYLARKVKARKKATWIHSISLTRCDRTHAFFSWYDKIYCVSEATKNAFLEHYPQYSEKAEVLYNYLDVVQIRSMSKQKIDEPDFHGEYIIVSVGRLAPEKGYDISIRAAKLLKEKNFKFRWFLIGEGPERDALQRMISSLELSEIVVLLGAKKNPMPYIKQADLYVQSSTNEGFGLTVAEALVLEKTVVASNIESFKEQIVDGENGYLVSNTPEALSDCICKVAHQKSEGIESAFHIKYSTLEEIFNIICC